MKEIELSTMVQESVLDLNAFEQRSSVHTKHQLFSWASSWNNILQIGMQQRGPDMSQVGSTWLDNLKNLRALRLISLAELNALGDRAAFVESGWPPDNDIPLRNGRVEPPGVNSIPWSLDTRLIYYRKDLLAKAGILEAEAFQTPEAMIETLHRLRAIGIRYPFGMATGGLVIHNMASWIWGRGGSFRSPDYRKISLIEPEGRKGMADFFSLHQFMDPAAQGMNYTQTNNAFFSGNNAVMLSGQWAMPEIKARKEWVIPDISENTGYAPPPGVPYVGSTHLVIWRHSLHDYDCLRLIDHLTSLPVLEKLFTISSNFPARCTALESAVFSVDPDYRMVIDCIKRGRGFRSARLWAGIEARLNVLCDQLWKDLFANPDLNLDAEIEKRISDLAPRIENTLMANW